MCRFWVPFTILIPSRLRWHLIRSSELGLPFWAKQVLQSRQLMFLPSFWISVYQYKFVLMTFGHVGLNLEFEFDIWWHSKSNVVPADLEGEGKLHDSVVFHLESNSYFDCLLRMHSSKMTHTPCWVGSSSLWSGEPRASGEVNLPAASSRSKERTPGGKGDQRNWGEELHWPPPNEISSWSRAYSWGAGGGGLEPEKAKTGPRMMGQKTVKKPHTPPSPGRTKALGGFSLTRSQTPWMRAAMEKNSPCN